MTSACPDVDVLTKSPSDELRAHLDACQSCAALLALRFGEPGDFGDDCRESESLLAVLACGALSESDERCLLRHLASCSRCMTLAADTLLPTAPTADDLKSSDLKTSDLKTGDVKTGDVNTGDVKTGDVKTMRWQQAVDSSDDLADRRGNKRARIFWSLGAVAAAAALALLVSSRDHSTLVQREQPEPDRATERLVTPERSLAGAARPITTPPAPARTIAAPPAPSRTIEDLVADASDRIKDTDYSGALALCESALITDPDHQQARMVCAIAACNEGEAGKASKHLAGIVSKTRAAGIKQICLRHGIQLDENASDVEASSADESAECQEKTKLSRADITKGINSIRDKVITCGARAEGMYEVEMTIGPDGRVTSAETRDDDVGECLATEVRKARFARSCKGMSVTYPFVFRRTE